MFANYTVHKNGFSIVNLKDLVSGTSASIIPSCGGILHSFSVAHHNNFINVIDQYESRDDFEQHVTSKGFKSCKLSPFACRIKDGVYQFGDSDYKIEKFYLQQNAIHGLLYDAEFTVIKQDAGEEEAKLVVQYEYRGADKGYPFSFDCLITYQLKKNNELIISTEIINKDNNPIPVQDGWHPYFTLGKKIDDLELQLSSLEQIVFDDTMIPTGKVIAYSEFTDSKKIGPAFFDDCFSLDFTVTRPLCILKDADNKIQVEIKPDKSYPWLQLYTPPHRQSMAIENLSAPPDTFNNGIDLMILQPEENAVFTTSYKVTILQ